MHKIRHLFCRIHQYFTAKCMFRNKPPIINPTKILHHTVTYEVHNMHKYVFALHITILQNAKLVNAIMQHAYTGV